MDDEARRSRNLATMQAIRELLRHGDWPGLLQHWADNGVMELPYAMPGVPSRAEGREAIAKSGEVSLAMFSRFETPVFELHPTTDPDVFFAEYESDAEIRQSGRPYRNTYVGYFLLRDGKVVHWKEYFNPNVVREAFRP